MTMQHETSRIYQVALDLNDRCSGVIDRMPTGMSALADQLRRAATSIPLNFAEGCRQKTPRARRRYFTIASRSAAEVSAILDVARCYRAISPEEAALAKDRCDHICAMLARYR